MTALCRGVIVPACLAVLCPMQMNGRTTRLATWGLTVKKSTKQNSSGQSVAEYYAFVFDSCAKSKDLHNVVAVRKIGKLTADQHDYLCKEFERYNKLGLVRFIADRLIPQDSDFTSTMLRGKVVELLDQEKLYECDQLLINTAIDIANKIRARSDCEHENIKIVPSKRSGKTQPPIEPANSKRDARIYELRKERKPFKEICDIVNEEFEGELLDEKNAGIALQRHCERNQIEYPYGKRGRKSL